MLIALLMLLIPIAIYFATFLFVGRWSPGLSYLYRIVGGIIAFGGGSISLYFAAYTGDQGGVAAFYFQIVVIFVYLLFLSIFLVTNWLMHK